VKIEKYDDDWNDERADGALAVIDLEAEIGQGEEPAEERERAVEVVIWNGVQAARAFERARSSVR